MDKAPKAIMGCCVLHNLCLEFSGDEDCNIYLREGEEHFGRNNTDVDTLMHDFEIEDNELRNIMMDD